MTKVMVYDLSTFDLFFLTKELKTLEGSKVDKIVQIDRKLFSFRFFLNKEKKNIRILVPEIVNITNQKYDSPLTPLGFCSFLRKYLQNAKLNKIYQYEFERILIFEFESKKHGELVLILELFKPGNMVLCKSENGILTILNSLEKQEFKARIIQSRQEYIFPPKQNNTPVLSKEELKQITSSSEKTLGKTLATNLSLGGVGAEEIILRSGLDKNSESLTNEELQILHKTLNSFFNEEIKCTKFKGKILPVQMKSLEVEGSYASFNEGLDSINLEVAGEEKKTKEAKTKKTKTAGLLDIQEKRIKNLEKEIEENQKTGEFIYEHYQEFSKLIEEIKKMRTKGKTFEEIEEEMKKNKHFKKIEKSKKTMHLEF